jgi:hypothetical protein
MSYIVDGKVLTEEEFKKLKEEIQNGHQFMLKLVEGTPNEYKTLQKLYG